MVRPKKDPALVKTEHLRVPLTVDQKTLIVEAAKQAGSDMAAWARETLVRCAEQQVGKRKKKRLVLVDSD